MINQLFRSLINFARGNSEKQPTPGQKLHNLLHRIKTNSDLTPQEISTLVLNCDFKDSTEALAQAIVMMHFHEGRIIELENKIKELTDK